MRDACGGWGEGARRGAAVGRPVEAALPAPAAVRHCTCARTQLLSRKPALHGAQLVPACAQGWEPWRSYALGRPSKERGRVLLEGACTQLTGVAPCSCFLFFLVHTAYALAVPPLSCAGNLVLGSGGLAPWQGTKGQQPGGQQDCMVKGETVGKFKCRTRVTVVAPVMNTSDR